MRVFHSSCGTKIHLFLLHFGFVFFPQRDLYILLLKFYFTIYLFMNLCFIFWYLQDLFLKIATKKSLVKMLQANKQKFRKCICWPLRSASLLPSFLFKISLSHTNTHKMLSSSYCPRLASSWHFLNRLSANIIQSKVKGLLWKEMSSKPSKEKKNKFSRFSNQFKQRNIIKRIFVSFFMHHLNYL